MQMRLRPIDLPRTMHGKVLIAGPCSAESEEQLLTTARRLHDMGVAILRAGVWKPRTKPGTFEGVGTVGLQWLAKAKAETGMMTATEVANAAHVAAALDAGTDILWIGTRTATDPFAVQEIADALSGHDTTVLIKNPIAPDPELWAGAIERIYNAGIRNIAAIHRGFAAYGQSTYRNRPQWDIPLELHNRLRGISIICDPSHIAGDSRLVGELCQQAMDLGMDGLIIESHCDPHAALSDARQQLTPSELDGIIGSLAIGDNACTPDERLNILRARIDEIDDSLIGLIARRMEVVAEIGEYKRTRQMTAFQDSRYHAVLDKWRDMAAKHGLPGAFVGKLYEMIHSEAINRQIDIIRHKP